MRRMTLAMAAVLAMSGAAWAQDPPAPAPPQEGEGRGRGPRRIETPQDPAREAEQRARFLKERLDLTDEQVQKAVEIYKQTREAEQKLETERQAKLREILTEDQKKKYDELIQNPGRGRGPMGGFDRMLENWADTLKKELSLGDEAFEKVKAIVEEFRKKTAERIAEMRQGGLQGMNWQEEWKKFQDGLKESGDKIKEHLTPEQKEKFDKLLEQFQPGRGFEGRGPSPEERAGRIVESFKIEKSDEQAAVKSAIVKVFEAQRALGEFDRDSRGKIEELNKDSSLSDEQLIARITEIRTARLEKDKVFRAAQKDLREMVSPRQELELIRQGVLR